MKLQIKYLSLSIVCLLLSLMLLNKAYSQAANDKPLRLVVIGATHGHVGWILGRKEKSIIALAGVYEPNQELTARYVKDYKLDPALFYTDLNKMLDEIKPEVAVAFGSIYGHMAAVEACAPRGIHVMVEKPLATNMEHAKKMDQLAKKHHIYLLTNYETSWYPSTEKAKRLVNDSNYIGAIRKVVIHDGHNGPKEIGVSKEFLTWLTDPVENGGGALIDFGCYGANLMTYLMKGEAPLTVTAVVKQFKPAIYPRVDDDATIIVTYPSAECIIQASWNWPFGRKDMEVYGETGYVLADNSTNMRIRGKDDKIEKAIKVSAKEVDVYEDPFPYFADVIRGKIKVPENGLYSIENNMTVVRILEAARLSAKTGKTVMFKDVK